MKTCPKCKLTYPTERTFCFVDGTDLVEMEDPRIGTLLAGRYIVEHVLGEGGMATVYAARHTLVDRSCAIKIMSPLLARDAVVRERFRREARAAQKLAHPNVIEIYDQGETEDGTSYIVMEHLRGMSLAELIQKGAIGIERAVGLMIQMVRGIARAHDLDVIHRDLKPENIFVCEREDTTDIVKLLDFGIARSLHDSRLTGQGELFGTPQYMAPERITNTDAGTPADLYALGIIFFEMVTGELPFHSPDIATFFVKHLKEPPAPPRRINPAVPEELEDLILRLLAKEPTGRPVDAHRVLQDLITLAKSRGFVIPPDPLLDPARSRRAPSTLTPEEPARWRKKTEVFERMLTSAFGRNAPADETRMLEEVRSLVARMSALRNKSVEVQQKLEQIAERGRDVRQRFGFAVDALGNDVSRSKGDERVAREGLVQLKERAMVARAHFMLAQKDVASWEGRSAFVVPYPDLADAYRRAADGMDSWLVARKEEEIAEAALETTRRAMNDIDFQVRELRNALMEHEKDIEIQEDASVAELTLATKEVDVLEKELDVLARRFCDPLRSRPELSPLFQELEGAAA